MPDANAQFRSDSEPIPYMGGTTIGCGDHPSLPAKHWWGAWRVYVMRNPDYIGRERMCKRCGLMSDVQTKSYNGGAVKW